jgi:hypothetical protein
MTEQIKLLMRVLQRGRAHLHPSFDHARITVHHSLSYPESEGFGLPLELGDGLLAHFLVNDFALGDVLHKTVSHFLLLFGTLPVQFEYKRVRVHWRGCDDMSAFSLFDEGEAPDGM